jgi:hypothetical protein
MSTHRGLEDVRRFDIRGVALAGTPPAPARRSARVPDGLVELPLGAWRRRERSQSNVITLRIPSWASSSSNP